MATFADIRRNVTLGAILSKNRFAEDASYFPGNGSASRTVRVLVQSVPAIFRDIGHERATTEEIDVLVSRELSAEILGETIGGIDSPRKGDSLVRATDPRPWFFDTVQKETDEDFTLRFSRHRVHQVGVGQAGKV